MDFHGLARRQLQALCKINKIPANITNVAMADALSALHTVEGIEGIMQAQTPEKAEARSPEVPRTVTRTSTRARKPPVTVLESGGVVPQSRSRTSRKLVGDDTVEDDKKDLTKTPAVASSRKRAPGAASRKKVEAVSVQKVYSTRRSVRLVEKQLSELCLEDSTKRTQPIKIDNELSSELTESGVKGDNFKMDISDKNAEELLVSDEVNSSEVSAQLVEAVDAACEVNGNEVLVNVVTGDTASEIVEKDIYETCAEDAMGAIGNADAEKGFEIIGHCVFNVSPLEEVAQPAETEDAACENQGVLVSGNGGTYATTSENMEKKISETCAEEALGGLDIADAEKDLEIVGDGEVVETVTAEEIVTSQMDSDIVSDILVQGDVALQFSADLEKEISSDFAIDSVTIGEDIFKTSADHEKLETSPNQMVKTDTEAFKHETETGILSSKEDGTIDDPASLSQLADDTVYQSDECDHDADSMTCQMGSPFHLSDHIEEDLTDDSKPLDGSLISKIGDPEVQHLHQQSAVKEPLATQGLNKENTGNSLMSGECFKTPKTPYEKMSIRRLQKMLKEMNIKTNSDKEKEGNATKETYNKHQDTPRPRHALQPLPELNTSNIQ
ncbi:unnamed protein product [Rhodiola kirilowii]